MFKLTTFETALVHGGTGDIVPEPSGPNPGPYPDTPRDGQAQTTGIGLLIVRIVIKIVTRR